MAKKDRRKVSEPSLNIWKACTTMKITVGAKVGGYTLNKNEFLFLVGEEADHYFFKDESGHKLKIHKRVIDAGKIKKAF